MRSETPSKLWNHSNHSFFSSFWEARNRDVSPIAGMIIQSDKLIFFRRIETTNQYDAVQDFCIAAVFPHIFLWGSCFWLCTPADLPPASSRRPPTHNLLTHNFFTYYVSTHTTYSYTTCPHISCPHTHIQLAHPQLTRPHTHIQLAHTQLTHAQLVHT